jgi:cytochrome c
MLPPGSADRGARLPSNTPPVLEPLAKTKGVWVVTVHPDAAPHTLSADDVYALTAYIPSLNGHASMSLPIAEATAQPSIFLVTSKKTRWKDRETG